MDDTKQDEIDSLLVCAVGDGYLTVRAQLVCWWDGVVLREADTVKDLGRHALGEKCPQCGAFIYVHGDNINIDFIPVQGLPDDHR